MVNVTQYPRTSLYVEGEILDGHQVLASTLEFLVNTWSGQEFLEIKIKLVIRVKLANSIGFQYFDDFTLKVESVS